MRGMLTDEVKKKSLELLGYEISLLELRLLPYVMYLVTNNIGVDPRKVNDKERKILAKWNKKGFVEFIKFYGKKDDGTTDCLDVEGLFKGLSKYLMNNYTIGRDYDLYERLLNRQK